MDDVEKVWRGVLDSLRYFPSEKPRNTMMDATGRQYDENLISNLLAYYTDSHNPHGFGTLIASALWHLHAPDKQRKFGNTTVEREYYTEAGNRIDLVIEADEDVIIAIENKIFSGLNNPLGEYRQTLHSRYRGKKLVCFVLAPDLLPPKSEEWQAITYHSLWKEVRALLGTYVSTTNLYWLSGLITLIEHTDNIKNMAEDLTLNDDEKYMLNKRSDIKKVVASFQDMQRKIVDFMGFWFEKTEKEVEEKQIGIQDERAKVNCWRWGKNFSEGILQVFEFKEIGCAIDFGITDLGIVLYFFARKSRNPSPFYRRVCNQLSGCEGLGKFKEINKGYYLLHEEINKTTFTKESMELLVSRAVELVQAVQEAIMSLPMDEQERGVGQSAPSAQ